MKNQAFIEVSSFAFQSSGARQMRGDFGPDDDLVKAAVILGALGVAFTLLAIIDYASKKKEQ